MAINLALYRRGGGGAWLMHEAAGPAPASRRLQVGRNQVEQLPDGSLRLAIDDLTTPWRRPLQGEVGLWPGPHRGEPACLHPERPHWWWPVAPCARVEVSFSRPQIRWAGRAYADTNWGDEPLAAAFRRWHWQRLWHPEGTLVGYAGSLADGRLWRHDQLLGPSGDTTPALPQAPMAALPRSHWGLRRACIGRPLAHRSLEDTPFYSRSALQVDWQGLPLHGMHEALDLGRFTRPWVQFLLPFRSRRSR